MSFAVNFFSGNLMFQIIIILYHCDEGNNFFNIRDTNFFAAVVYEARIFCHALLMGQGLF